MIILPFPTLHTSKQYEHIKVSKSKISILSYLCQKCLDTENLIRTSRKTTRLREDCEDRISNRVHIVN